VNAQPQLAQAIAERLPGDAQNFGGMQLIPIRKTQRCRQQNSIELQMGFVVKVIAARTQPLANERIKIKILCGRCVLQNPLGLFQLGQKLGQQNISLCSQQCLLQHAL